MATSNKNIIGQKERSSSRQYVLTREWDTDVSRGKIDEIRQIVLKNEAVKNVIIKRKYVAVREKMSFV